MGSPPHSVLRAPLSHRERGRGEASLATTDSGDAIGFLRHAVQCLLQFEGLFFHIIARLDIKGLSVYNGDPVKRLRNDKLIPAASKDPPALGAVGQRHD